MTEANSRPTSPQRRLPKRAIAAIVFLPCAGILIAVCACLQPGQLMQEHVIKLERESQFNRQLDQFVELRFGRPVMLRAWLEEWSRQSGIPVEVKHSETADPQDIAAHRISLDLPPVTARRALDSLGQRYGAAWEQQEHEKIILHWYRDGLERQHEIVHFPGPEFLTFHYPT